MTAEELAAAIEQKQFELDRWTAAGPLHFMQAKLRAELRALKGDPPEELKGVVRYNDPEQTFRLVG